MKHAGETPQCQALISPNYRACLSLFWPSGGARRECRRAGINSVPWGAEDYSQAESKCAPLACRCYSFPLCSACRGSEYFSLRPLLLNSCSELEHNTSATAETTMGLNYWARDRTANVEECCSSLLAVEGQIWADIVVCSLLEAPNSSLHYVCVE